MLLITSIRFFNLDSQFQFCEAGIGYGESSCGASIPSSSKLLIKGGTVVNAHHQQIADVYVEDGVIVAVNPTITVLLFRTLLLFQFFFVQEASVFYYFSTVAI